MAVNILKGKQVKLVRVREALEDEAIVALKRIVIAHDELNRGRGVKRHKAARKFPLIMKKARRLVTELSSEKLAA